LLAAESKPRDPQKGKRHALAQLVQGEHRLAPERAIERIHRHCRALRNRQRHSRARVRAGLCGRAMALVVRTRRRSS